MKPLIVIGSLQEHAAIKEATICTTLTSAMGLGGGQIPMIVGKENVKWKNGEIFPDLRGDTK